MNKPTFNIPIGRLLIMGLVSLTLWAILIWGVIGISHAQGILYGQPVIEVTRWSDYGHPRDTQVTVGAQINSRNGFGVHQIAFGIATEATALQGSLSRLVGGEFSTVNLEPQNEMRKIAIWATFKNRMDVHYFREGDPPANVDSQALRIESEPGTGFERGIVFSRHSLRSSNRVSPSVIDFSEVPLEELKTFALFKFPDGYSLYYTGNGTFESRRN